jgi:hypothetical protein
MRTIAILITMTALAIGAQKMGYVDFQSLSDKAVPLLEWAEIKDKDPQYTIIGLDITAGREGELDKDRAAIAELVKNARLGDRIEVYLIHSRAESEQDAVFTAHISENPGAAGQELVRAKQKADKEWSGCWEERVNSMLSSDKKQRTDLFGFMRFVTTQKPEFQAHKHPRLVLFTDGQQVGDGFNMEKKPPTMAQLKKLKDDDLIPELNGINVRFAGFTPTHKISNAHWRKLQNFWKEYAKEAGAESVAITSERKVSLN